jgi:large subunit ribosomal protein L10
MAITKQKKEELVADLASKLREAKSIVFTDYRGLTVEELNEVRNELRKQGIEYKVLKNTLFKIAAKEADLDIVLENAGGHPIAAAFGYLDEVAPAKVVNTYAGKNEKLEILGGVLEGKEINAIMVKSLAKMPSREELYGKLVGTLAAPMSGMVNVLQGNIRGLVNVLSAINDQK